MTEIHDFGAWLLLAGCALAAAVAAAGLTRRLHLPTPVVFLAIGYAVGAAVPEATELLDPLETSRVGTVALIVILFAGGLATGGRAVLAEGRAVLALGLVGTAATALAVGLAAHTVAGLEWTPALILGAILAPTDPAAVFSLLRGRDVSPRASSILQGEAGINDPIGIVLTVALLESAEGDLSVGGVLGEMALEAVIGVAVAAAVLAALRLAGRSHALVSQAALPLLLAGVAFATYGAAAVAGGSGFLAVYLLGLALAGRPVWGDRGATEVHGLLSEVAEAGIFLALGIALNLVALRPELAAGLVLAAILVVVIRPAVALALLAAEDLRRIERAICVLGGLKGAVPLVLGSLPFLFDLEQAPEIFALTAIVSVASILAQGIAVSVTIDRNGS